MSITLHTTLGPLKLQLFCESCPKTCENFLALCGSGVYDGVKVHRVVKDFIAQTGDPTGTGKGGKALIDLQNDEEIRVGLRHTYVGTVSMAKLSQPDPNSSQPSQPQKVNGSQFFFTLAPNLKSLDGEYTVFGRIISGLEILEEINGLEVDKKKRPVKPVIIERVEVHANPLAQ